MIGVRAVASFWVVLALLTLSGCEKTSETTIDSGVIADPAATTASTPHERAPTASPHTARPEAAPIAVPPLSAPPLTVRGSPAPSSSSGNVPLEHPLAAWMRGEATTAFNSGDLESIASTFDRMAPWAPPGYTNWASIALDGGRAARSGSIEGVKAACRGCHTQYMADYRAHLATRPLS